MSARAVVPNGNPVSLHDKWVVDQGAVVMSGTQAIARVLLAQATLDHRKGISSAGYISGYRGSPLGGVDSTLWAIGDRLESAKILFRPGVNEDIAATAIRGTQQLNAVPGARYAGVFSAWYGKGPGVDRSGDALKHGNYAGSHPLGGVLIFYGDDHAGKSSTVAHQSEQAVAASLIPSLYPADVQEVLSYGLLGFAMSRYSGSWVGIKCVNEVAEQTATVDLNLDHFDPVVPPLPPDVPPEIHVHKASYNPLREEQVVIEHRLPLVHAFVRANQIDRIVINTDAPALGLVTAGKSYGDVRAALALLGLDDTSASASGISLYKVGCIWPLEPKGIADFAAGQLTLLVVEEKKSFLEQQIAAALINDEHRPLVIGKFDEEGSPLLSSVMPLEPIDIAFAIAARLERLGRLDERMRSRIDGLASTSSVDHAIAVRRLPFFCSGCPHSRSTRVPEGSVSMTGIGCHTMVAFVRPQQALLPTHMGGEGGNWIGLAPFTETKHMFQNMGDGTYYHSGLLAIRAAVAARVNITYKILYNDAVAMTGGQPVDGPISVAAIASQVRSEGVARIALLSDDPSRHEGNPEFPDGVTIDHRDELDAVQQELRDIPGCTVLIYEQTCAAEKRRRRKRGGYPNPPKRLFIAPEVCEGCGDCSVQSTCVSLAPVETAMGRKRAIDQSSCNKDYSCLNGFCPSFVTIYGAEPRKPKGAIIEEKIFGELPLPARAPLGSVSFNVMIAGIGGTGVVTVGAILGMAAHMEGLAISLFDMTGLSQKNGAVYSHVRIAASRDAIHTQRLGKQDADVLLAFDLIAALAPDSASTLCVGRTRVIANTKVTPTLAFQFNRDFTTSPETLRAQLQRKVGEGAVSEVDASSLALAILGDTIGANMFVVGVAAQQGLLPVSVETIERAIGLNNVAVAFNLRAFRLGRLCVKDPNRVLELAKSVQPAQEPVPSTLSDVIAQRKSHLTEYQNAALAERYGTVVGKVRDLEAKVAPGSEALALTVARNYAKLLAYKDEYEVARLLSSPALREEIGKVFEDGGRIALNLAPPFFNFRKINGRPEKREFGSWMLGVMWVMARMRGIRGTLLDPFAYTHERRMERALITQYEGLVEDVLVSLDSGNHSHALALLSLADDVRGYGPVKAAAVATYHARVSSAHQEYYCMGEEAKQGKTGR